MFRSTSPAYSIDPILARKVWGLIFGRLSLILLIVLAGWWWVYSGPQLSLSSIQNELGLLFLVSIALTVVYVFWLKFSRTLLWHVRAQFLIDAILITWLVWETGDLISPYITLYIILISLAGFFLGKTDALVIAGACTVCFTALPILTTQSLVSSLTGEVAPSRVVQTIAFNDAAFLLVGLLAARLADRRKIGEDLKQAEANFANLSVLHERILASINSGLITTDLQGRIYAFNRAAEKITGLRTENVIGQSVFSLFGDEIRPPIEMCLEGAQTVEFSPPNFEAGVRMTANGIGSETPVTVSCTVLPLVGGSGGVTGLIIAFQDTTELRLMEETLRRSDRLAAVGRMAAGLAHEIRNPLGSMSSALQFLSEKSKSDNDETALMGVVLRESDRLNSIITDFLAYAQPGSRDLTVQGSSQMDVGEAVKDCIALLRHDPGVLESHVFDFVLPKNKVMIQAEETQIKQIFWNLFQNSIHAMPAGGRLTVKLSQPSLNQVRIVVSDTGCGIDAENIARIFEPFHSGANGTGLGLSIVHRIVTGRGGRIDVQSTVGNGTRITIDLPK